MLNTHVSPVVELFQQVFVQVRGADSSNLLVSDQGRQLLPGRLKISQGLAVPFHGSRGSNNNRVELRHTQCLASLKIRDRQESYNFKHRLCPIRGGCSLGGTGDSPISTASLMEDWTGSHRNSFTVTGKRNIRKVPCRLCTGLMETPLLLKPIQPLKKRADKLSIKKHLKLIVRLCLCSQQSWIGTWNLQFLPLFGWDCIRFLGNGTVESVWKLLEEEKQL